MFVAAGVFNAATGIPNEEPGSSDDTRIFGVGLPADTKALRGQTVENFRRGAEEDHLLEPARLWSTVEQIGK